MSKNITPAARAVIVDAVTSARRAGAHQVREEDLLWAVLSHRTGDPVLRSLSPALDADQIRAEIGSRRRRAGLSAGEGQALAGMGIDLGAIVERAEAVLGEGALDPATTATRHPTWRGPKVSAGVEKVLMASHHQALNRGDRAVDVPHLLLGLLAQGGLAADALAGRAVTVTSVLELLERHYSELGAR